MKLYLEEDELEDVQKLLETNKEQLSLQESLKFVKQKEYKEKESKEEVDIIWTIDCLVVPFSLASLHNSHLSIWVLAHFPFNPY